MWSPRLLVLGCRMWWCFGVDWVSSIRCINVFIFPKTKKKKKERTIPSLLCHLRSRQELQAFWSKFDVSYLDHRDFYRFMIRSVRGGSWILHSSEREKLSSFSSFLSSTIIVCTRKNNGDDCQALQWIWDAPHRVGDNNTVLVLRDAICYLIIGSFGLWKVPAEKTADTVYNAIKAGYRLFDGAFGMWSISQNEFISNVDWG